MQQHEGNQYSDPSRSRGRGYKENHTFKEHIDQQELQSMLELKQQNNKLKKMLKDAQAKRTQITKQCSALSKTIEKLESENEALRQQARDQQHKCEGEKYRWEELKFLNKQLSTEIQELRNQNEGLTQKLRYSSDTLERKYEELEEKTYKRMEQCVKRVKKAIHYLQSLSVKNLEKTREDLIENLRKSIELLRGKYYQQLNCEGEIDELMNPLKAMQEEISQKTKEASHYKQENIRLLQEMSKYKEMEKQQIPMFKAAIEKLKKNLAQVRSQLSENEYEKMQLKKKYEQKLKEAQYKYNQIFKECRKIKLEKKIYQNKLEELQADVEEEKERLLGENQMLKKLYQNNDTSSSRISQASNYRFTGLAEKKTQEKRGLQKNYSSNQLKTSNIRQPLRGSVEDYDISTPGEVSEYNQESSTLSKENLKHEICRLDQEIMEIQRSLNRELQSYK